MYARLFGSGYHNPNGLAGIIFGRGLFVFFLSFFLFSFFSFRSGIYRFMGGGVFFLPPSHGSVPADPLSQHAVVRFPAPVRDVCCRVTRSHSPLCEILTKKRPTTRCDLGLRYESVGPKGSRRQSRVRCHASNFPNCTYR